MSLWHFINLFKSLKSYVKLFFLNEYTPYKCYVPKSTKGVPIGKIPIFLFNFLVLCFENEKMLQKINPSLSLATPITLFLTPPSPPLDGVTNPIEEGQQK